MDVMSTFFNILNLDTPSLTCCLDVLSSLVLEFRLLTVDEGDWKVDTREQISYSLFEGSFRVDKRVVTQYCECFGTTIEKRTIILLVWHPRHIMLA